jgi:hypothetical protein
MFSTLRMRFGIPGVISVIALVFAMFGGAYAASNSSGGSKATASAKAKKGPRGPKGATGPAGPAGLQGPAGAKGDAGANGTNGSNGAAGADGTNGTGVTATESNTTFTGGKCLNVGGSKFVSASGETFACNGKAGTNGTNGTTGPQGPKGDPWTAGGTLPEGATETGAWAISSETGTGPVAETYAVGSISFPIPLAAGLDASHVLLATLGSVPAECENSAHAGDAFASNPEASPGYLCIYEGPAREHMEALEVLSANGGFGTDISGADVVGTPNAANAYALGTWAVTGAPAP